MLSRMMPFLLMITPIAAGATDRQVQIAAVVQAHQQLAAHLTADGAQLDHSPAAVMGLQGEWSAARALVRAILDENPDVAPAALTAQAKAAGLDLEMVRLDPATLLIGARAGQFGTAFLLHRGSDGHFGVPLALDAPPSAVSRVPELAAWQAARAGPACAHGADGSAWRRCGPMTVARLIPLPREAGGNRRFAIVGMYVEPMGGTVPYQVSIWRWDGRTASPLMVRTFRQSLQDPVFVAQDAQGFTLRAKEQFASFPACEECSGRQVAWHFTLPVAGVVPPTVRSLAPELDAVDRLYAARDAHRPLRDLASAAVIAKIGNVETNTIQRWRLMAGRPGISRLCVDAITFDRPQIFRLVRHHEGFWIADLSFGNPHACDGPGSHD